MIITSIQFIIFISYVVYIYSKYGVLSSISNSYYKLPNNLKILFTLFCFSLGFLMVFHGGVLFFLSGAGLSFTGAAAAYEYKGAYTNLVHYIGAGVCISMALLGLFFHFNIQLPSYLFLLFTALIFLFKMKNKMWWIEIASFLLIMIGLFFHYLGG